MTTEVGTADMSVVLKQSLEVYLAERGAAGKDQIKLAAAEKRFVESLRKGKISDTVINATTTFLAAIPGKEVEGVSALLEAMKKRVDRIQNLQEDQARLTMHALAEPEQAKVKIASFGVSIATICRFFGADEAADMIESKAQEILSTVNIKLNAQGITAGEGDITSTMSRIQERLMGSAALDNLGKKAARSNQDLPVPAESLPSGATDARRPVSWSEYKKGFKDLGLTDKETDSLMAPWMKAAAGSGGKAQLDSNAEIETFLKSQQVTALSPDKKVQVEKFSRQPTPMGTQSGS